MVWIHIHLEAFCMYSPMSKKLWKTYRMNKNFTFSKKARITKNKNYISKSKRPKWCKNQNKKLIPQFRCMKCPFFAYTNATRNDYKLFDKTHSEKIKS